MTIDKILLVFAALYSLTFLVWQFGPAGVRDFLFRARGVTPSGPDGAFTRRDALKAALWSFGAAVLLAAAGFFSSVLAAQWPDDSLAHRGAIGLMFGSVVLGGIAFLAGLLHLGSVARNSSGSAGSDSGDREEGSSATYGPPEDP